MNKVELEEHVKSLQRYETEIQEFKERLLDCTITPLKEACLPHGMDWSGDLEFYIARLIDKLEEHLMIMPE